MVGEVLRASQILAGSHQPYMPLVTLTVQLFRGVARPGGPESSLFGSGLRASGRGLTLEFLLWHGVDMYIEQLTHEDFTQTTRSAPVTAVCTWTFPCRPVDTSARSWENMFQSMPRLSRTFSAVLRCGAMIYLTHTVPDSCISTRSDRLLMDLASQRCAR